MAGVSMTKAIFLTVFTCLQVTCAAKMEITPTKFDGLLTTAVNISCVPDSVGTSIKAVVGIQIVRGEQRMVSLQRGSEMVYGTGLTTVVQAEGLIDSNISKCFLRLTMPHVLLRDSGKYLCNVYLVDEMGFLDEDEVWEKLVVDDQDIQTHIAFLLKKVTVQEDMIKELGHELKEERKMTSERFVQMENFNMNQSKHVQELMINGTHLSAFSASIKTKSYPIKPRDVLVFGDVVTKKGKGYDENTGLFTAPYRGLYAFHLSVFSCQAGKDAQVTIQVEDNVVAFVRAIDKTSWDQSSASCVVFLDAGDVVKTVVKHAISGSQLSYFKHDSVFSGYLVKAL